MEEVIIGGVVDPAFDWDGVVLIRKEMVLVVVGGKGGEQGKIASATSEDGRGREKNIHTLVEDVACGTVVDDDHLAEIGLDRADVLDVVAAAKGAVLAVVPPDEVLAILLEPVDDRVGILLDRGREDDELIPFADLELQDKDTRLSTRMSLKGGKHEKLQHGKQGADLAQKVIAMRPFVHVVQYRVLRRERGAAAEPDGRVELDLDHMAGAHATAPGEAVYQRLVEVQDEGLGSQSGWVRVGRLPPGDQRRGRGWCSGIFCPPQGRGWGSG